MRKLTSPEPELLKPNAFGFPSVWIPFGKQTVIQGDSSVYEVKKDKVLDPKSIETLAGIPVYCSHPGIQTKDNANEPAFVQVGVARDVWRESEDQLGGEVLCRITSPDVYKLLEDKVLVESSPAYKMEGRIFNHLGLFKKGQSRGGEIMTILLEGKDEDVQEGLIYQKIPYSEEVYTVQLDTASIRGELNTNLVDSVPLLEVPQLTETLQITELQLKQSQEIMEDLINEVLSKLNTLLLKEEESEAKELVAMEGRVNEVIKTNEELQTKTEDLKTESFNRGFEAGQKAGEILFTAKSFGFMGEELNKAVEFVVNKAFPTIALEGMADSFTNNLFDGAIKELHRKEELAKTTIEKTPEELDKSPKEVVLEGKPTEPKLPTVSGDGAPKTLPPRYKLVEATL